MSFVKFLIKHASEMRTIGDAFSTLNNLVQGDREDKKRVQEAGELARRVADSIEASIDSVKDLVEIKPSRDDIKDIVAELLPDIVAKILSQMAKPTVKKPVTKKVK